MDKFTVDRAGRVFLGEKEIFPCLMFQVDAQPDAVPEVLIRVAVESVDMADFTGDSLRFLAADRERQPQQKPPFWRRGGNAR